MFESLGVLPPPKTALVLLATAPAPLILYVKSPKSCAFPNVLTEKNCVSRGECVFGGGVGGWLAAEAAK